VSVELLRIRGPLDDEKLGWLTQIYGPVDAKYRSLDYVRHQFVANPFGWSVHVFAVAAEGAVGHCGVVPFAARLGDEPATVGKLEALAVAPAHRGRRAEDGGSVATDILTTLYAFAHENELPILFGLAPPPVARIHMRAGCRQVPLDAPAYVLVSDPRSFGRTEPSRKRRAAATALSLAQSALTARARATPQPVIAADAELAAAETADGTWTVSGADAWDWYAGSGVLRALELPDSRVLVRVDEAAETTVQIVAWRATRGGLLPAARALRAAARVARDRHAPTLRFQPWRGSGGGGELARACRLLGFVRRPEAPLLVHTSDERFDRAAPRLTPFFYVTF
jgi:hypothetical protein